MNEKAKKYAGRAAMLVCGALLAALPAMAQQPGDDGAPPPPATAEMGHGAQHAHFRHMEEELNLTPDQARVFRQAREDAHAKMEALRQDTGLSQDEVHHRMMEIHRQAVEQQRAVLTDEQKVKFDAMQQERRAHMEQRREQRDGGDAGAPPPPQQ